MPQSKEQRRKTAEEIQTAWGALSPEEQLKHLDRRLGRGVGAQKQRAKIARRIAEAESIAAAAGKNK
jgi:hypothetical protein